MDDAKNTMPDDGRGTSSPLSLRAAALWGTALASLVALPALSARPWADERFILYWPEKIAGARPWRLLSQAIREIPAYLDTGNFRPVSRFEFYLEHWAVVRASVASGIPPNVTMGFVKVTMLALLVMALLWTLNQYRRAASMSDYGIPWRMVVGATVVFFAVSIVLYNPSRHPLTLFPGLYLSATGFALLVPVWLGREWLRTTGPAARGSRFGRPVVLATWFLVGAIAAASIELTYMAIPLGIAHIVLLAVAAGQRLKAAVRGVLASGVFRSWLALSVGFLAVFIPTRTAITLYCRDLPCYRATEPAVGLDFLSVLPSRALAGFFPVTVGGDHPYLTRAPHVSPEYLAIGFLVAVIAGVWLWRTIRPHGAPPDERRLSSGTFAGPLGLYLGVMLVLASSLGALSSAVQDSGFVLNPWRETAFVWVAWSGLFGLGAALLLERLRGRRWAAVLAVALIAGMVVPSIVVNYRNMERVRLQTVGRLHIEAGTLLVNFDRTPEGNTNRCDVIDGLAVVGPSGSEARKAALVADFLDVAARNHWGKLYCDRDLE